MTDKSAVAKPVEKCEKHEAHANKEWMADEESGLGQAFNSSAYERDIKLQANGFPEHTHRAHR